MVMEVVIIDGDINDTDELEGEPEVLLNGQILRMAQTRDGNWRAYFAMLDPARVADPNLT